MKIESFLARPQSVLREKIPSFSWSSFSEYPEVCYVPISAYENVQELIDTEKIDAEYQTNCIRIEYEGKMLLDYDINGLNLWEDLLFAVKRVLESGKHENIFGIDQLYLKMTSLDSGLLEWKVFSEGQTDHLEIVNQNEFLSGLIKGGIEYYSTLLNHKHYYDISTLEEHLKTFYELEKKMNK